MANNKHKCLKAFIIEDTSISATMLLHKSKLNPVVFCECPARSDKKTYAESQMTGSKTGIKALKVFLWKVESSPA